MIKQEVKYWAGLIAAAVGGLVAAGALAHPYDKYAMGLAAACMAVSAYNITPGGSSPNA